MGSAGIDVAVRECFEQALSRNSGVRQDIGYAKRLFFDIKISLMSILAYSVVIPDGEPCFRIASEYFLERNMVSRKTVDAMFNIAPILDDTAGKLLEACEDSRNIPLSSCYQMLLNYELSFCGDCFEIIYTKAQRNASGSYYTPGKFAKVVTERAFEQLIGKPLLTADSASLPEEFKVADLSCGAGDFLVAAIENLAHLGVPNNKIALSVWAYDVDPIALLLAYATALRATSLPPASKVANIFANHFILGNPLLLDKEASSRKGAGYEKRVEMFALGRLYSPEMALPTNAYPNSGFDLLLGNPPWEKLRFEEKHFFEALDPSIARITSKHSRAEAMLAGRLKDSIGVYELYDDLNGDYVTLKDRFIESGIEMPSGELNTSTLFLQVVRLRLARFGLAAQIVKSSFATSAVNSVYFSSLLKSNDLKEIHFFTNEKKIFPIDLRERFSVVFLEKRNEPSTWISFGNVVSEDIRISKMIPLDTEDLRIINPITQLIPDVKRNEDYYLLVKVQKSLPVFSEVYQDAHFGRLVHLTAHSSSIVRKCHDGYLGVYEGKFIGSHDMRFSTFEGVSDHERYVPKARARLLSEEEKRVCAPEPRFFIEAKCWSKISRNYSEPLMFCWRSLTSSTNARTAIGSLSVFRPACQSVQLLQMESLKDLVVLAGLFNSLVFDYFVRMKLPSIDLTQAIIRQMPVPAREAYEEVSIIDGERASRQQHIVNRVLSLYINEDELIKIVFASGMNFSFVEKTRSDLLAELDELFFDCYRLSYADRELVRRAFKRA